MTIDENGDSEGSYILLGLVRDEDIGCAENGMRTVLEKVGYFHYSDGPAVSFKTVNRITYVSYVSGSREIPER